jgi:hypothetical protein
VNVLDQCSNAIKVTVEDLDRVMPDWYNRMNVETFDFINTEKCVAGQLSLFDDSRINQSGFDSPLESEHKDFVYSYDLMHNIWVDLINTRREISAAKQ